MEGGGSESSMCLSRGARADKVKWIFNRFDLNSDGGLNREEMAALVVAVNPCVKFSDAQICVILDNVFRTYAEFISPASGLSLPGLLRTYEDGAGDVDGDFRALSLHLEPSVDAAGERHEYSFSRSNSGVVFGSTWAFLDDLDVLIKRLRGNQRNTGAAVGVGGDNNFEILSDDGWRRQLGNSANTHHQANFAKELAGLSSRADAARSREEAFDGHYAVGRELYNNGLFSEALVNCRRASELQPTYVRPHFLAGNALYALGRHGEAKEEFLLALDLTEAAENTVQWAHLLPQIHINLGVSMEAEGLLLGACEHYREAAILRSSDSRALKLLGSALLGAGEPSAAVKALEEAVFFRPDYADAHCDLGSALHAMGNEDERAIQEFQKAIDLNPNHVDALYNFGGLLMHLGRFPMALDMYSRVIAEQPGHWRAHLNNAAALLGAGEIEEATKAMQEAFLMTKRVEIYDAIVHLKMLQKLNKRKKKNGLRDDEELAFLVVKPAKFTTTGLETTVRQNLTHALEIRAFQSLSGLGQCDAQVLSDQLIEVDAPAAPVKSVRKAAAEAILRQILHFLKAETFQNAFKAINKKILSVMDAGNSGSALDLGMLFAVLAPVCAGEADRRKRAAFDSLLWRRTSGNGNNHLMKSDAIAYLKLLRAIFITSEGASGLMELVPSVSEESNISFMEFVEMFDDQDWGFGILRTLMKLEAGDRSRRGARKCSICRYPIKGSRFKEKIRRFSLCKQYYIDGKVPLSCKQGEYSFNEYESEIDDMKDKCDCFSFQFKILDN